MGNLTTSSSAAEMLLRFPAAISVFARLGIPLGLGEKSIQSVAMERGINPHLLLSLLFVTQHHRAYNLDLLSSADGVTLVEYLLASHAYYSGSANPRIAELIRSMRAGESRRELELVESFYRKYSQEVEQHFRYECDVAFPYMRHLFEGGEPRRGEYSVRVYKQRHENIEEKLYDLKSLLVKYLPTSGAYQARCELYLRIQELADDLNAHACIEDHILIPLVERAEGAWRA